MSIGRVLSGCAASLAVAGCAVVAFGMSRAASRPSDQSSGTSAAVTRVSRPVYLPMSTAAGIVAATSRAGSSSTPSRIATASTAPAVVRPSATRTPAAPAPHPTRTTHAAARTSSVARTTSSAPRPAATTSASRTTAALRGQALPLGYRTGTATRVITVTARSTRSTTATLQAWTKAAGGGWRKYGTSVTAHVGSDGLSSHPSEYRSATPIGSFTLTQAFGHYADPGTALPYLHTRPSDWWISQAGPLYNTHQRCSSGCGFTLGSPNEHLYYEMPYYRYAVVIDYNTRNAPGGVVQGAGSAFFLHVTDGYATAGCVAIGQAKLISLMRWLTPSSHPRILIGVT